MGISRYLSALRGKFLYHAYCTAVKIRQYPAILRERKPSFLSDDLIVEPSGSIYAVVVKYSGFGLGDDYVNLLASLKEAGVNTIVVCNGRPSKASHEILKQYAHRILVRVNVGRDMGAYRAATLYLHEQGLRPERMLYFNDSVVYLKGKPLSELIARLVDSPYDVVGAFENHQFNYHVGSYVFSMSGAVFDDPRIRRFWRRYRPYDLRTHAISRGEIALSTQMRRRGYGIDVVYSAERLSQRLYGLDLIGLIGLVKFMRPAFRSNPLDDIVARPLAARRLKKAIAGQEEEDDTALPATPTIKQYAAHRAALRRSARTAEAAEEVTETLARHALIDRLMNEVTGSSQIHVGFGLYHRLLDCPLIKKDLLVRAIYHEHDCSMILDRLPDDERSPIMRELVSRGRPIDVRGMRRFLLDHGLI